MSNPKETASGSFMEPPPGAPRETAQDLRPELVAEQLAKAQRNERALPPLTFSPGASPAPIQPPAPQRSTPVAAGPAAGPAVLPLTAPGDELLPSPIILTDADPLREAVQQIHAAAPKTHQPAASDSDSPARGIPRPIADPGKQITGGFGHALEQQYFPLDGQELKTLVQTLLDDLRQQIENDLHFTIAITYPRVTVRLRLDVTGYTEDEGFSITKARGHEKTPEPIAQFAGTPFEHALEAVRREFDEQGEPENTPDRLRDEMGLEKPRKQVVESGGQRMIVDIPKIGR